MLSFYLYKSHIACELSFPDIVAQSMVNNARSGLTGFLYRDTFHFYQYFEGRRVACERLIGRLHQDSRHCEMRVLAHGRIKYPKFPGWSLCYKRSDNGHKLSKSIDQLSNPTEIIQFMSVEADLQLRQMAKPCKTVRTQSLDLFS